eukprot:TRINITY_DN3217_c0_g1_i3.p1 TRINITY_DN3217_c0_g1~~TRINITY_DN3217_c0_g1_i3.p1  ORF type:complete len:344 (+),score=70.60 TRINITY_DN3217_c0_g1_i3:470-1501(+)
MVTFTLSGAPAAVTTLSAISMYCCRKLWATRAHCARRQVRQPNTHAHDHSFGVCSKCHSAPPQDYTGEVRNEDDETGGETGFDDNGLISTLDNDVGTKDTQVNFGEMLDPVDWEEADRQCKKADLCIIAGTSMSLRHITHFPFFAKKTALINLQPTPDDRKVDVRLWSTCDTVFDTLLALLGLPLNPVPVWHPRDALPIAEIPQYVRRKYVDAAVRLSRRALFEGGVEVGHTLSPSSPAPGSRHCFTVFVRPAAVCRTADMSTVLRAVDFTLPTAKPAAATVTGSPFAVTAECDSAGPVRARVLLRVLVEPHRVAPQELVVEHMVDFGGAPEVANARKLPAML